MKPKIESDVWLSLVTDVRPCVLTEGETDKNHPGQNLPDKNIRTKTPAN